MQFPSCHCAGATQSDATALTELAYLSVVCRVVAMASECRLVHLEAGASVLTGTHGTRVRLLRCKGIQKDALTGGVELKQHTHAQNGGSQTDHHVFS